MSPGISIGGLASGIDTEGLLSQLMALERNAGATFKTQERQVQTRQTALRDIVGRVRSLDREVEALRSAALWTDVQTVESADATKIGARRVAGAGPGSYAVEVRALARAEQHTYAFTPSAAASSLTLTDTATGKAVQVDLAANATLADAVTAINSNAESPAYAVAVKNALGVEELVLSSKKTGAVGAFTATGASLTSGGVSKSAQDAEYRVDGATTWQTSSSNTVTDAVPGLELTLKGVTGAGGVAVTVGAPGLDRDAVKARVKAFVDQYNSVVDLVRSKVNERRVAKPATESDNLKGVLSGDSMLSGMLTRMRNVLSEAVGTDPAQIDRLSEIGVSTGAATGGSSTADSLAGKLVLDEAKLFKAIETDPGAVKRILGAVAGEDGITGRLDKVFGPISDAGGGIDTRISSADREVSRLRARMTDFDRRMELKEQRLRSQFKAMEGALANSQNQANWLSGQLAALYR